MIHKVIWSTRKKQVTWQIPLHLSLTPLYTSWSSCSMINIQHMRAVVYVNIKKRGDDRAAYHWSSILSGTPVSFWHRQSKYQWKGISPNYHLKVCTTCMLCIYILFFCFYAWHSRCDKKVYIIRPLKHILCFNALRTSAVCELWYQKIVD